MTDPNCLFCRIVAGTIPSKKVHDDAQCIAFEDINPQAPTHVLVVPKKHIATTGDIAEGDEALTGHLVRVAASIAAARGIAASGYRTVFNCNAAAGQTVFHIHLHLLGGKPMGWPPWP